MSFSVSTISIVTRVSCLCRLLCRKVFVHDVPFASETSPPVVFQDDVKTGDCFHRDVIEHIQPEASFWCPEVTMTPDFALTNAYSQPVTTKIRGSGRPYLGDKSEM